MRLLLDECTPRALGRLLAPHEVAHVTGLGWNGVKNGELLARMRTSGYAGLITTDKNLSFQQSLQGSGIFVAVLVAHSNRVGDLVPLMPELQRVLSGATPGRVYRIGV